MSEENRTVEGEDPVEGAAKLGSRLKRLVKRFGVAGFVFFTLKGIAWILVSLGLFKWIGGC